MTVRVGCVSECYVVLFHGVFEGACFLVCRVRVVAEHRERGRVGLIESRERRACRQQLMMMMIRVYMLLLLLLIVIRFVAAAAY